MVTGDRLGRKKLFSLTILLMALSTALIGLLPGYYSPGAVAPVLLLILRLLQGLSMGGEIGGALTYVQEVIPRNKTFATCAMACGVLLGISLGHAVHLTFIT